MSFQHRTENNSPEAALTLNDTEYIGSRFPYYRSRRKNNCKNQDSVSSCIPFRFLSK
jgi:hypothetical protein